MIEAALEELREKGGQLLIAVTHDINVICDDPARLTYDVDHWRLETDDGGTARFNRATYIERTPAK